MTVYVGLFLSAFLAATLVPAQSEALLLYLLNQGYSAWLLVLFASVGNVLGSVVNYGLGRWLYHHRHKPWFFFSENSMTRATHHYYRYGVYSLLFSWLPVVGDPLTFIAGVLNERFWRFFMLVAVAKTARYIVLYGLYAGLFG